MKVRLFKFAPIVPLLYIGRESNISKNSKFTEINKPVITIDIC